MDRLEVAQVYDNRMKAEMAAALLDSYGVDCIVQGDDLGGVGPGQSFVNGVRVLVEADQLARARELLKKEE